MRTRILALFLLMLAPMMALAQPLADRLPGDAIVYLGWRGVDNLGPAYQGSHLKGVLDASNLPKVFSEFLPAVMKRIGQEARPATEAAELLSVVGPALWKHPSALYIGPVEQQGGGPPIPKMAVLCDAGADAPALLDAINKALAKAGNAPVQAKAFGNVVAVWFGNLDFGGAVAGLDKAKPFTDAMAQVNKDPVIAFYFDMEALVKLGDQMLAQAPPRQQQIWQKVREVVGLDSIKRIALTAGFDQKDWSVQGFIDSPAPRKGFIGSLLNSKPLSADLLKLVPVTATTVMAGQFDINGFVSGLRDVVGQIEPRAQEQMDQGLAKLNEKLGLDIQKDFLATLGSEWVMYSAPDVAGNGLLGFTLINRLTDPAKAEQAMGKLEQLFNEKLGSNDTKRRPNFAFSQTKSGDMTIHYLAIPVVSPSWAIKDGNLYVALYPQVVSAAADFAASKGKSILDNESFQAVRARLGGKNETSIMYADLPKTAGNGYQMMLLISRTLMGAGDLFGVKSPEMVIPPLNKLLAHLAPAGAVEWIDDAGWHMKGIEPFPGSQLLGGGAVVAAAATAVPLGAAITLPALSKARQSATRVKCMNNLSQIGQGCMLYANDNKGKLPAKLGELVLGVQFNPSIFICPDARNALPGNLTKPEDQAAWVNEHSDYVYLGAGKKMSEMGAETVLCHEKEGNHHGQGVNVLFGDGHVDWMPIPALHQALERKP